MNAAYKSGIYILLLAAMGAQAAEPTQTDRDTARVAVNFCGEIVGTDSAKAKSIAASMPDIVLHPAEVSKNAKAQSAVTRVLHLPGDAPFHRITFKKPPVDPIVFGALSPDIGSCAVIIAGGSNVPRATRDLVDAAGSGWVEIRGPRAEQTAWQHARRGESYTTLTVTTTPASTIVSVESDFGKLPTLADFEQFADSAVKPCVALVTGDEKFDATKFAPRFSVLEKAADGATYLQVQDELVSARIAIVPETWGSTCILMIDDRGLPLGYYEDALRLSFQRATNPKSKRSANMNITPRDKSLVMIIKRDE